MDLQERDGGVALERAGRGIESSAVFVKLCPCYGCRARLVQTLPLCIALSAGLTGAEVGSHVFPSLLLPAGWDQPSPAVCPCHLLESPIGLRGLVLTSCERLGIINPHLSEKASALLQVLQVR